jgi:hypothetical protein
MMLCPQSPARWSAFLDNIVQRSMKASVELAIRTEPADFIKLEHGAASNVIAPFAPGQ